MDQGILRFTWYSLTLVAKGYALALLIGTPIGFFLGLSKAFTKTFDPIIQILRPVSPLAWLPLGLVLFLGTGKNASELGALFTIAVCAMWPTVLNTAVGVRAIPRFRALSVLHQLLGAVLRRRTLCPERSIPPDGGLLPAALISQLVPSGLSVRLRRVPPG